MEKNIVMLKQTNLNGIKNEPSSRNEKKPLSKYISSDEIIQNSSNLNAQLSRQHLIDEFKKQSLIKESSKRTVKKKGAKLKYLIDQSNYIDTLHHKTIKVF